MSMSTAYSIRVPRKPRSIFPDIASIEELRGPQGTLYGKNTTSGAINITTEKPVSTFEARGSVGYGDFDYANASGTVSGALNDDETLQGRLSAIVTNRDGFISNVTTDSRDHDFHDYGARGQLLYQPTNDLSVRFIADYNKQREQCCINMFTGVLETLANGGDTAAQLLSALRTVRLHAAADRSLCAHHGREFGISRNHGAGRTFRSGRLAVEAA